MNSDLIGTRLGKYEVQSDIGRGGMGAVYKGYDPTLKRHVAVKVLAPHLLWQGEFVERFLREARAAARLNHPNIVTIHDVGQEGGWYYFVMEYLEGQTLTEFVQRRGPLPTDEVIRILRPLAGALDYAHDRGVVHRDVKSDNILVSPSGLVTLTDFGIARAVQETRLTTTGAIVGTPEYMSPEQVKGLTVDARSDQYSLAALAYEMLSGRVPFKAESTLALLHKIAYDPPPPIRQARPELPAGVEAVLAKALAKKPGDRFPTVSAFVEALNRALAGEEVAVGPAPVQVVPGVSPAAPARRVPAWAWALGGVAALALLIVVGAALVGGLMRASERARKQEGTPALTEATDTPRPTETPRLEATATPVPLPTSTRRPTPEATDTPAARYPVDVRGRVLFTRKSLPWSTNTSEIWMLNLDADSLTQLTHNNAVDWIPDWSPDGSRVTFTSDREGNYDLWVMEADGSKQESWITLDAWDDYPRWSPDGKWLAFASTGETEGEWNSEIFVASSNANLRRVTFNTGADEWPSWSPDGRRLACSSDRDGDMDIYVFSAADGSGIVNWTADTAYNEQPAWSPDGAWIAFIRKAQTSPGEQAIFGDVWVGRLDGSEFRQLTRGNYAITPAWSPDGRYIVFSNYWDSTGDGEITSEDASDLWAIPVGGGEAFALTEGPEQDYAPRWVR